MILSFTVLPLCCPTAPNTFFYYSTKSKTNYSLSTFNDNQTTQETYCNSIGGHLASYDSQAEQNEVEQAFIKQVGQAAGRHSRDNKPI